MRPVHHIFFGILSGLLLAAVPAATIASPTIYWGQFATVQSDTDGNGLFTYALTAGTSPLTFIMGGNHTFELAFYGMQEIYDTPDWESSYLPEQDIVRWTYTGADPITLNESLRFVTIEEPTDLAEAFASLPPDTEVALLDCLTVWIGNLMHKHGDSYDAEYPEIDVFFDAIADPPVDVILVTNEVGSGVIPDNAMARRFRDLAGTINQRAAARADKVILCVSGIPVTIKG